ncbi:hypothetical protein [Psychroserpens jangbogonensis]|uniref:hypothetical protein n=1 Tax=Psychroserpens jangbogonensis TaxID=1484460 RepID=UPI00053DEB2C|nr:hypothetical protein [Psychroserpens jangbogonensis]
MKKLKSLFLICTVYFISTQLINGQEKQNFLFTKGDNNISVITMGDTSSPHCTIIEYPEYLVLHEIPKIPVEKNKENSITTEDDKAKPLITFIDSIYLNKPIKYILNSHHHSHSLSIITPFLENGAKLVTTKENIKTHNKKGLFGNKTSDSYSESIIQISSDTTLLAETKNPIDVLYLKKSDYNSIPTETYLFFNFPEQKLLATSCMVYLKDINEKYGYKGIVYNNRLIDVNKIITDKNLKVKNTLQLYKFTYDNGNRKPPIFSISHLEKVLEHSWHRRKLSEHFQSMSYEELTTNKDNLLEYHIENSIYHIILNHAVYELIEKKDYPKAVLLAQILLLYEPDRIDYIDTLGEAHFNNGQINMAKYYNEIIKESKSNTEEIGLVMWETNQKDRLKNSN